MATFPLQIQVFLSWKKQEHAGYIQYQLLCKMLAYYFVLSGFTSLPLATPELLDGHLNARWRLGPGRKITEEEERTEEERWNQTRQNYNLVFCIKTDIVPCMLLFSYKKTKTWLWSGKVAIKHNHYNRNIVNYNRNVVSIVSKHL